MSDSDLSWVSFATDEDGCLGVAFVRMQPGEDDSRLGAMMFVARLHREGLNPGGEVQWMTTGEATWKARSGEHWPWLAERIGTLIPIADLVEQGYVALADLGPESRRRVEAQLAELAAEHRDRNREAEEETL